MVWIDLKRNAVLAQTAGVHGEGQSWTAFDRRNHSHPVLNPAYSWFV